MFRFEKLEVWKKAIELVKEVLQLANNLPQRYQFSIGEQLKRAVISVINNIAEASGRKTIKESSNLYNIAKGSIYEVVSLLYILKEENLIKSEEYKIVYEKCEEIAKMLTGLIRLNNE